VLDFDSDGDPRRALAVEAAENAQRRDYTPTEVLALYERLVASGFTTRRGKPKEGEKPARPAIASIIGRSVRTVNRMLKQAKGGKGTPVPLSTQPAMSGVGVAPEVHEALRQMERACARLEAALASTVSDGPVLELKLAIEGAGLKRLATSARRHVEAEPARRPTLHALPPVDTHPTEC